MRSGRVEPLAAPHPAQSRVLTVEDISSEFSRNLLLMSSERDLRHYLSISYHNKWMKGFKSRQRIG